MESSASNDKNNPLRLHLGCGETYLKEYFNIDFPQSQHTIVSIKADAYQDLRTLWYKEGTVSEVRNHHVLEHFSRGEAFGLLLNWHRWLKNGGVLFVETPDFEESAKEFFKASIEKKGPLLRHIFGSHEAAWAVHYDGWFEEKYRYVLEKLGFDVVKIVKMKNNLAKKLDYQLNTLFDVVAKLTPTPIQDAVGVNTLPNILCVAKKNNKTIDEAKVAEEILSDYLVGKEKENKDILKVWMKDLEKVLKSGHD